SPVIARVMTLLSEEGRQIAATAQEVDEAAAPVDHLADIEAVCAGEKRVRTQTVLARLIAKKPDEYGKWTLTDLSAPLGSHGLAAGKSHGIMGSRADDVASAVPARKDASEGEAVREDAGSRGVLPRAANPSTPPPDQGKASRGRRKATAPKSPE